MHAMVPDSLISHRQQYDSGNSLGPLLRYYLGKGGMEETKYFLRSGGNTKNMTISKYQLGLDLRMEEGIPTMVPTVFPLIPSSNMYPFCLLLLKA